MSEQGKYVSRSEERQSWSWLVAEDLVNFPWYLLHRLGLGPKLGSGESAITWLGVPICWVIKMSVKCTYICWPIGLLDELVDKLLESGVGLSAGSCKVRCDWPGVTHQAWPITCDGLKVSWLVGISWGFPLQHTPLGPFPWPNGVVDLDIAVGGDGSDLHDFSGGSNGFRDYHR